ncbi:hypothetical protein [Solimonas sp. SE-A11]|nr:hypothetical protein [Solimonas sp. SE-A11]MDM4768654.1 hypothetical protein [Solimonas sp. SE-A11]
MFIADITIHIDPLALVALLHLLAARNAERTLDRLARRKRRRSDR